MGKEELMVAHLQAVAIIVAQYLGTVGTAVLEVGKKIIGL